METASPLPLPSRTLLLIEDDEVQARRVAAVLAGAGGHRWSVLRASTLAAGRAVLRGTAVDAVLLDLGLPDARGIEAVRAIRGDSPTVSIVVLTADDSDDLASDALRLGADDHLVKEHTTPSDIRRALRHSDARRQRREEELLARAALERSEAFLADAQRVAHMGSFEWEPRTGALKWSDELFRIFGVPAGAPPLGLADVLQRVHPDDREALAAAVTAALSEGGEYRSEYRVVHPDGTVLFISARGRVERPGPEARLIGIVQDVTEAHAAEADRLRLLEKLEATARALEHAQTIGQIGSFAADAATGRVTWSRETHRICGIAEADFDGRMESFWAIVHPDDRERVQRQFEALVDTGTGPDADLRIVRPDGVLRWIQWHGERSDADRNEVWGVVQDVTDRKLVEEQLLQAQKMEAIGRLAGGIAHDFNNLLGVILGYAELLARSAPDAGSRGRVEQIVAAGERAAGLTRQLLAFSRKQVLEPKVIDLNALVANVERMLKRLIGEDVHLAAGLDPELGAVKADPGQVEQVLINLVVNARDAMPRGGRITIETRNVDLDAAYAAERQEVTPGPHVLLAVSDTGTGMDAETLSRIFEPFFTTKDAGRGTGLGLATAYGTIKQSGGHIAVYSEIGRGTSFKVYLPRVAGPADRGPAPDRPVPAGTETILLVEDEDSLRMVTREVLEESGYTVLDAGSGASALEAAGRHAGAIDLLVTDVVMPKMGGREVAQALGATRPDVRVLFMSGYTDDAVVRHGVLEEGTAFLQKPFSLGALLVKVREVLDAPDARG